MEQTAEQRYSYWLESGLEDEMVKKELSEQEAIDLWEQA